MPAAIQFVLIVVAWGGAFCDLRTRRIPNWINVSGVVLGLGLNVYFDGVHGGIASVGGVLTAICVYFPMYSLKGMGAGDVKLMAAVGAIAGAGNWFSIFIITALLGGIFSLALVLLTRRLNQTILNLYIIATQLIKRKAPTDKDSSLSIHDEESLKLPHGATIAAGVAVFLLFHRYA